MEGTIRYSLSDELALKEAKMAAVGNVPRALDLIVFDADNIRWQIHLQHLGWLDGNDLRFRKCLLHPKLRCK